MDKQALCFAFVLALQIVASVGNFFIPSLQASDELARLRSEVRAPKKEDAEQEREEERKRAAEQERRRQRQLSQSYCHHGYPNLQCKYCSPSILTTSGVLGSTLVASPQAATTPNHWSQGSSDGLAPLDLQLDSTGVPNQTHHRIQDPESLNSYWSLFPSYPYQDQRGYLIPEDAGWYALGLPEWKAFFGARLSGGYGATFQDLQSVDSELLIDTFFRVGLEMDQRWIVEDQSGPSNDSLWLGDANLFFRLSNRPEVEIRFGVGFNYLSDRVQSDFGPNFTAGLDWFPGRPLLFSAEIDVGTLGQANLIHVRTTGGLIKRRFEPYIGFDYVDIESFEMTSLISGLRIWF